MDIHSIEVLAKYREARGAARKMMFTLRILFQYC